VAADPSSVVILMIVPLPSGIGFCRFSSFALFGNLVVYKERQRRQPIASR